MNDWIQKPKHNPPPEGMLVEIEGFDCWGRWTLVAKKVTYKKPPHKRMKPGCWRWVKENNERLDDQAVTAWKLRDSNE